MSDGVTPSEIHQKPSPFAGLKHKDPDIAEPLLPDPVIEVSLKRRMHPAKRRNLKNLF
jgi:hypothetical protein